SAYIPPMQAFWVRVDVDNTPATLKFVNLARAHQDQTSATNRLRARQLNTAQVLRLQVSNGINNDEALIVADPNAQDAFDTYDSQKMTNANVNIPEIFTLVGSEELVINHMNNLTGNKELSLGFRPGKTSNFSIEASEISNLSSDTKVVLLDKLKGTEQELTVGSPYTFASDATATNDRFSLIFRTNSIATDLTKTANKGVLVYRNLNNHIAVICNQGIDDQSSVSIYNAVGQKLSTQKLTKTTTEINHALTAGVYLVTVHNGGQTVTEKVIIK
ncbi:MAG: T9SS type A sorting domain-containing protein, partial [Paludibacter sp.]|nr:T9SS type A sorting domain-containing protein [Paludibacter sp.]